MTSEINIVLVDDHKIFADSLAVALSRFDCFTVLQTFNSSKGVLEFLEIMKLRLLIFKCQGQMVWILPLLPKENFRKLK
jgi:DNA-binding NarL/FixJ family response regulator